jgi:hypothetical protein
MEPTGMSGLKLISAASILKTANEQPRLAGELISTTVQNMASRSAQTPVQAVDILEITGTGQIINITA